ncbi:Hint domain-containing protein [Aliiroseovarius sp.]|uniref:Hint domain-containing protein n=1 Tax=Aliiroseovarius sp. TaxID=1872442 RepID=UPI00262F4FC4|nr:Hint domain-containing protein [Aliiroseovarius sp.]
MLSFRDNWAELDAELDFSGEQSFPRAVPKCRGGAFALSGLSPDAMILTDQGERPARDLVAGDLVMTRDNGMQPVLWAGRSRDPKTGPAPVRFKARGQGEGSMVLAPGHLALLDHAKAELLFGVSEVLVHASDLTDLPGVSPAHRSAPAWVHLLLPGHELVRAAGVWVESLAPDMRQMECSHPDLAEEICTTVPRLRYAQGRAAYQVPRVVIDHKELSLLLSL